METYHDFLWDYEADDLLLFRYFFPPTAEDLAARRQHDAGEVLSSASSEEATVAKREGQARDEEDWEEVEKPESTSQDGVEGLGAEKEVYASSSSEDSEVAPKGDETIGKATENRLGKDW